MNHGTGVIKEKKIGSKLEFGEACYTYKKLDDRMAILVYRPKIYQGRSDVVLYANLDFAQGKDRAVVDGTMREVATPPRP